MGAQRQLQDYLEGLDRELIQEFALTKGIDWKFSTPFPLHHNGAIKTLIKPDKSISGFIRVPPYSQRRRAGYDRKVANRVDRDHMNHV